MKFKDPLAKYNKTIIDPMGLGLGDAIYGKNKGPDYSAEEAAKQTAFEKKQAAADEFVAGGPAKYEKGDDLVYESLSPAEKLQWQSLSPAERQEKSGMFDIKTDPRYKEHEMAALRELEDQSQNGFTARDKADMQRVENSTNRVNKGRLGAIQQNMQARGMSGSGMDLVAQMQSSQDANEIAAMKAIEQEGMMQDRKSSATRDLGQMSSQLQSRDFGQESAKAQAQDAINRFNTQNSNDNARYNNQGQNQTAQNNWQQSNSDNRYNNQNQNQTAEANWSRSNTTSDRNSGAQYQYNQDRLNAKLDQATGAFNYAQDTLNEKKQRNKDAEDAAGGKMGAVLGTAGAVVGGIYGGPAGAAAGGQLGSSVGQGVGRTAYKNSYAAHGGYVEEPTGFNASAGFDDQFAVDDFRNDIVPVMLSPKEVVLPRSVASSPKKAAQFVDNLNKNPDNDSISERNNPNFGRSPDYTKIDPAVLNHLAKENPSLVESYRKKMEAADSKVNSAKDTAKWGGYADVAGNLLTDYNNSQRHDIILGNRMEDLGRKQDRIEAKPGTWKSVAPAFDKKVTDAENERDRIFTDTQRGAQVDVMGKQAEGMDSGSSTSQRAQLLAKSVLSAKASEAERAGDKAGAEQLRNMDVSSMSASEAKDFYDGLKNSDYKDVLNNQAADKRLGMQLSAYKEKGDKSDRDTTFRLSERYNSDQTTKDTAQVRASSMRAEELAKTVSPTNDMGLVYSLMKSFDPGSTVREGEFAMAAKSGSLGDQMKAYVSIIESGQMTKEKRAEVLNTIRKQAQAQEKRQAQVDNYYSDLSTQYKADPNLVIGKKGSTAQGQKNETKIMHGGDLP